MVNAQDLEEEDDIYFTCSVNANPPAYKLTWWHNVSVDDDGHVDKNMCYSEKKNSSDIWRKTNNVFAEPRLKHWHRYTHRWKESITQTSLV